MFRLDYNVYGACYIYRAEGETLYNTIEEAIASYKENNFYDGRWYVVDITTDEIVKDNEAEVNRKEALAMIKRFEAKVVEANEKLLRVKSAKSIERVRKDIEWYNERIAMLREEI